MAIAVTCYIFSLMILCLAGMFWLRARRLERCSKSTVERMKLNMQLSRGSRNARSRMWLRELQEKQKGQRGWQRRNANNRFRPSPADARQKGSLERLQQVFKKRRKALLKAFGGRK